MGIGEVEEGNRDKNPVCRILKYFQRQRGMPSSEWFLFITVDCAGWLVGTWKRRCYNWINQTPSPVNTSLQFYVSSAPNSKPICSRPAPQTAFITQWPNFCPSQSSTFDPVHDRPATRTCAALSRLILLVDVLFLRQLPFSSVGWY